MIVTTAERGGTFRETFAMAKAFTDARKEHGASELLDEIVTHRPKTERIKAHSKEELKEGYLTEIRDAVAPRRRQGDRRRSSATTASSSSPSPRRSPRRRRRRAPRTASAAAEAAAIAEIEGALGVA